MLIDSHCHLDFEALAADIDGVMARAAAAGVTGMVTISTWVDKFSTYADIAERFPNVWCSVGTHPHNADQELHIQTEDLVRLSAHPRCIAIGEAGLDYFYDNAPREAQEIGLRRHIAAARITGLPLVIHSRQADDDMAAILEEETGQGAFPFVLHCFTAGMDLAQRALALGGYISFSGIITFKNAKEIQDVAAMVPADRYLVETDAPYLAPIPHRGQSNEPSFVRHTAEKVAEIRGVTLEQVGRESTANFGRLFAKSGVM
ncbi:TatD family hydrolase [Devosia sp. 63-57]|uniref:TatD family hydrolase n=1 Tax=Devosia sp. 63-57 TaxID=1895751 RepID=UPI00086B723A|nr:TatD family hydrolase [Devosia sp. 63-57]ODT50029.1 MAG: LuxR family transcriptional regulator [Pelagibacterium sp. SCN 63-126]ODU85883.1 MAG: LuxR family transcriptional regulator [Pelagibacterium sp. SCN 63-17]OJX45288.1 MAG: LuxR family transcriptional regulator [Devosia sp. 63-57]